MSKFRRKIASSTNQVIGDHKNYISRIKKTLYYGRLTNTDNLSVPVTELAAEFFSEAHKGKSLSRLHYEDAAKISREACVSPCSLVIALIYLDKLKACDPEYVDRTCPTDLFLVSLMISSKFLYDDGEVDEVFMDEWAACADITAKQLATLEKHFLKAINWELFVHSNNFWRKLNEMEIMVAKSQGRFRGYYTYSDLERLLNLLDLYALIKHILNAYVGLTLSYITCALALSCPILMNNSVLNYNAQSSSNMEFRSLVRLKNDSPPYTMQKNESQLNMCSEDGKLEQLTTWQWWTTPSLLWLSENASCYDTPKDDETTVTTEHFRHFFGNSDKQLVIDQLQEIMDEHSQTRIQDQLERKWHTEWIDSLVHDFRTFSSHAKR